MDTGGDLAASVCDQPQNRSWKTRLCDDPFGSGIRDAAGDICALKFREIDWHKKVITYAQQKSGKINALPLLSPIGDAIIDYLKNGRLDSDCRQCIHPSRPSVWADCFQFHTIRKYQTVYATGRDDNPKTQGSTLHAPYGGKHASQGWCSPHDDQ